MNNLVLNSELFKAHRLAKRALRDRSRSFWMVGFSAIAYCAFVATMLTDGPWGYWIAAASAFFLVVGSLFYWIFEIQARRIEEAGEKLAGLLEISKEELFLLRVGILKKSVPEILRSKGSAYMDAKFSLGVSEEGLSDLIRIDLEINQLYQMADEFRLVENLDYKDIFDDGKCRLQVV